MRLDLLDRLLAAHGAGEPAALATELATGAQALILATGTEGELDLDESTLAALREAAAADRSGLVETAAGRFFVDVLNPAPRLVVVGAVHIAQALLRMAALAGYRSILVDPRGAFATPERFPDAELVGDWPDEALARLRLDRQTAVVTLTHDPKLDDPALIAALDSPAFYVGALGSRRTHEARLKRLAETGLGEAALARIHGPIGLKIGALTPAEIALSIMAELTLVRRGAAPLR